MSLAAGIQLGRYEICSKLGAGGMGEVYLARDMEIGRDVAIKVLPSTFSDDQERLQRFQLEARAAGALNHPNILSNYDIGKHDGAPYVVSELLEGEDVRAKISGSPLSQRRAIDYALQMAHGLAAAHEKGIIHRDLKPDNIFITNDGRAKIFRLWSGEAHAGRWQSKTDRHPHEARRYRSRSGARNGWLHVTGTIEGSPRGPALRHLLVRRNTL